MKHAKCGEHYSANQHLGPPGRLPRTAITWKPGRHEVYFDADACLSSLWAFIKDCTVPLWCSTEAGTPTPCGHHVAHHMLVQQTAECFQPQ
jgi:hypothetical protein